MSEPEKRKYDVTMMAALCMLVLAGLLILYSTSAYNGQIKFQDPFYYLKKQLFATALLELRGCMWRPGSIIICGGMWQCLGIWRRSSCQ